MTAGLMEVKERATKKKTKKEKKKNKGRQNTEKKTGITFLILF